MEFTNQPQLFFSYIKIHTANETFKTPESSPGSHLKILKNKIG